MQTTRDDTAFVSSDLRHRKVLQRTENYKYLAILSVRYVFNAYVHFCIHNMLEPFQHPVSIQDDGRVLAYYDAISHVISINRS